MNTLLRYMEANGMKNELEHLFLEFFFFFLTHVGKTDKAASQQQFQVFNPVYSDT